VFFACTLRTQVSQLTCDLHLTVNDNIEVRLALARRQQLRDRMDEAAPGSFDARVQARLDEGATAFEAQWWPFHGDLGNDRDDNVSQYRGGCGGADDIGEGVAIADLSVVLAKTRINFLDHVVERLHDCIHCVRVYATLDDDNDGGVGGGGGGGVGGGGGGGGVSARRAHCTTLDTTVIRSVYYFSVERWLTAFAARTDDDDGGGDDDDGGDDGGDGGGGDGGDVSSVGDADNDVGVSSRRRLFVRCVEDMNDDSTIRHLRTFINQVGSSTLASDNHFLPSITLAFVNHHTLISFALFSFVFYHVGAARSLASVNHYLPCLCYQTLTLVFLSLYFSLPGERDC
jgi:hypothetical protein